MPQSQYRVQSLWSVVAFDGALQCHVASTNHVVQSEDQAIAEHLATAFPVPLVGPPNPCAGQETREWQRDRLIVSAV